MTAELILSRLRLNPFDPTIHTEAQQSTRFPAYAIIPHVLPDGSANPDWAHASHCVMLDGPDHFIVRAISDL